MTIFDRYVGCDVSKEWLDLFDPAEGRVRRRNGFGRDLPWLLVPGLRLRRNRDDSRRVGFASEWLSAVPHARAFQVVIPAKPKPRAGIGAVHTRPPVGKSRHPPHAAGESGAGARESAALQDASRWQPKIKPNSG